MGLLGVLALFAFSARVATMPAKEVVSDESLAINEITGTTTVVTNPAESTETGDRRMYPSEEETETLAGEEKFTGTLEEVNVGCFADGECYVVVDGKHITVMMGWTNATVGSVLGVEGFGDLEYFIGEKVSVYAGKKTDGTYTLYQKDTYFVKLESAVGVSVALAKSVTAGGLTITPKKVTEDSRCPMGVMCIQAGTVKLEVVVEKAGKSELVIFELGQTKSVLGQTVTLFRVDPQKEVDVAVTDYLFFFGVQ